MKMVSIPKRVAALAGVGTKAEWIAANIPSEEALKKIGVGSNGTKITKAEYDEEDNVFIVDLQSKDGVAMGELFGFVKSVKKGWPMLDEPKLLPKKNGFTCVFATPPKLLV